VSRRVQQLTGKTPQKSGKPAQKEGENDVPPARNSSSRNLGPSVGRNWVNHSRKGSYPGPRPYLNRREKYSPTKRALSRKIGKKVKNVDGDKWKIRPLVDRTRTQDVTKNGERKGGRRLSRKGSASRGKSSRKQR